MNGRTLQQQQADLANEILDVLEQATALGFGQDAAELVAASDGATRLTQVALQALRRRIRESHARFRSDTREVELSKISQRWQQCEALAKRLGERAQSGRLFDVALASESILSAVLWFNEAQHRASSRRRSRGKPSSLTTPEAEKFILDLADVWQAYTRRPPRAGGGKTAGGNFNHFVVAAFAIAGVDVNPYSVPRRTREILR